MDLIQELKSHDNYKNLSEYQIRKVIGKEYGQSRATNKQLTDKISKSRFNFTGLPLELQDIILSEYSLIPSQTVDKTSRKITQQSFFNQMCVKPISVKEIKNYINNYLPEHIYFFYHEKHVNRSNIVHMGAMKYTLIDMDNINKYLYYLTYEIVEQIDINVSYSIIKSNDHKEIKIYPTRLPDLLTQYFIYKNRKCDDIRAGFSKNKILEELKSTYDKLYIDEYTSLLSLYLYIKVNLSRFPVLIPINTYPGYKMSDEKITLNGNNVKYNKFIDELFVVIDDLYEILVIQINKL